MSLAARQSALVAALVGGGPLPPGFDEARVRAAAVALLRKRSDEVGAAWPALRAVYGEGWASAFSAWAANRPTRGSLRDGWDFAEHTRQTDAWTDEAAHELALRQVRLAYDGAAPPRRRRWPARRRTPSSSVIQVLGRVWVRSSGRP